MGSDDRNRYSGFLTSDDRNWLQNDNWQETGEKARQTRRGIRQRAARALRDLAVLESSLPEQNDDRKLIFKSLFDTDTWDELPGSTSPKDPRNPQSYMRTLFRFVFAGSEGYLGWADEGIIENVEDWVRVGLKQAFPGDYFDVNITRIAADDLDELEREFRENEPDPEGHKLSSQEMTALFQSQRISVEEYLEHADHSDIVDISGDPTPQNEES